MKRDERLKMLSDRRAEFLKRHDAGESMAAIARDHKVTRARVSQLVKRARADAAPSDPVAV